ncbi:MAG: hypothetical protein GYA52_10365 [Chloroflexi bacterium]|nr:hypothetical protein [Chloroflexota bacterium]
MNPDPWFEDQNDPSRVIAYLTNCGAWNPPAGYSDGICHETRTPVQDALDASYEGAVLHLDAGTYEETVGVSKRVTLTSTGGTAIIHAINLLYGADVSGSSGVYAPIINIAQGASIQDGITLVEINGVVNIGNGLFSENVIVDKEGITLQGSESTIIDGTDAGNGITINADEVTIKNLEIINGDNGIAGETSNSVIQDNKIHGQKNRGGNNGVGILLWGENCNNQILNNTIFNTDRQGVFIGYENDSKNNQGNILSGNTIYDYGNYVLENGPDESAYGIQLWNADQNLIAENEIYGYDGHWWFASAIYLCDANANLIEDNYLHDNNQGISQYNPADPAKTNTARENILTGNTIGVKNYAGIFDARYNFWGCSRGPDHPSCDPANGSVAFDPWLSDPDGDSIYQSSDKTGGYIDNCPSVYNPDQADSDGDGIGDACEEDIVVKGAGKKSKDIVASTDNNGNADVEVVVKKNETTKVSIEVVTDSEYKEKTRNNAQKKIDAMDKLNDEEKESAFNFVEKLIENPASLEINIPPNAVEEGAQINLQHTADENMLPANMEDAVFLGSMISIEGIHENGEELNEFSGKLTISFTLPEGTVIPEGMELSLQYYDENQGWVSLPIEMDNGIAYAEIDTTGVFALALV